MSLTSLIPRRVKRLVRQYLDGDASYHELAIRRANRYRPIRGSKVLIVGANTGEDCELFLRHGAAEVHGLDVMEEIGTGFQHPAVQYHRQSIENTDLPSESYDLVFAVATMEHVPDIRAGFREMARLTRKNGLMFSEASPLWQSPSGHHMGCFPAYPWIHLLFPHPAELAIYARNQGITGERGHTIEAIAEYMLCPDNFNMLPGTDYVAACADLPGMRLVENRLCRGDAAPLHTEFGQRALKAGYTTENLAAVQHRVIARKG